MCMIYFYFLVCVCARLRTPHSRQPRTTLDCTAFVVVQVYVCVSECVCAGNAEKTSSHTRASVCVYAVCVCVLYYREIKPLIDRES